MLEAVQVHGPDQAFAAFEMVQDRGVRDARDLGHLLQAQARGTRLGHAALGGVEDQGAGFLGGAADPFGGAQGTGLTILSTTL